MKMTNATMIALVNAIKHFSFVTGKLGYAMARTKSKCIQELEAYNEIQQKIFEKYGTFDDEAQSYYVKEDDKENYDKFNNEIIELLNAEIDVDVYMIPKADFELPYSDSATVQDYEIIESLLVEKDK